MASQNIPAVSGERLGMRGDVGVGKPGPTPDTRHDDAARRHPVGVPDLKEFP